MDGYNQSRYLTPASRITVVAHLFGITALILLLVWLLHYRTGFDLDSSHPERVFNLHPFLMFFGFIFFAGEGCGVARGGLVVVGWGCGWRMVEEDEKELERVGRLERLDYWSREVVRKCGEGSKEGYLRGRLGKGLSKEGGYNMVMRAAAMAYKTIRASREVQKFCHMLFHLIAIVLGIVGIYTAFKFHNMQHISHMHSLHSWIGMITFCFFGLQWLFGFALFMFPKARPFTREMAMPWHISGGRALLYMAICTAETGLMQIEPLTSKFSLINFIGLFILFFGITVDLSIALGHYV
ncbi:unnamed protein product [Camellia sinensis]